MVMEVGKFTLRETYLKMIGNATGSKMFRSSFFQTGADSTQDLCQNGKLSCAFFVSSILKIFDLIETLHTTVKGLERDLLKSGWFPHSHVDYRTGSVVVWKPQVSRDGEIHAHAGFLLDNWAVSNHPKGDKIIRHGLTFGGSRRIERLYFHEKLLP